MTRGLIGNMSIKNVILKSGDQLITDIKEGMIVDKETKEEKLICYQLYNPCLLVVDETVRTEETTEKLTVALFPWPQLSSETEVKISLDWVVTIVEPTEDLKTLYTTKVLNNGSREEATESDNDGSAD